MSWAYGVPKRNHLHTSPRRGLKHRGTAADEGRRAVDHRPFPPAPLQVIKRGVTELADIVVINKADGPTKAAAARAAAAFKSTVRFHRQRRRSWQPAVLTCSAHTGEGVDRLQETLGEYALALAGSGELAGLRRAQRERVAWTAAEEAVLDAFRQDPCVRYLMARLLPDVQSGQLAPRSAAELLAAFHSMYH